MAFYQLPPAKARGLNHTRIGACMDMRHEQRDIADANRVAKSPRIVQAKWNYEPGKVTLVKAKR